jgi:hypothetical protein
MKTNYQVPWELDLEHDELIRLRKRSGFKVKSERIHTYFDYPPIPIRSMDWSAYRDGYEPGCLIGRGPTKDAAIADLLEQEYDNGL